MLYKFKKIFFLFLSFTIISLNYSLYTEEIKKEYLYNIFGGGKEKIIGLKGNINDIKINQADIDINFFDNYSNIKIIYTLKNDGDDAEILFAYPKIDAKVNKIFEETGNKKKC